MVGLVPRETSGIAERGDSCFRISYDLTGVGGTHFGRSRGLVVQGGTF